MSARRFNIFFALATVLLPVACLRQASQMQPVNPAANTGSVEQCSTLGNLLCGAVSMISGEKAVEGRGVCIARVESSGRRVEQCAPVPVSEASIANLPTQSPPDTKPEGAKTAHLSWKDNSSNETGFRIYRITGNQIIKIAEVGANITSYVDKAAPVKSCYVVVAFNSGGDSAPTAKVCLSD